MEPRGPTGPSAVFLATALVVPVAGLALLLSRPSLDVHWEHHPSHFWLVFGVATAERRARPDRERGRPPQRRRAALPGVDGAADERRLPGPARAGHARRGARAARTAASCWRRRSASSWPRPSRPLSALEMDDRTEATCRPAADADAGRPGHRAARVGGRLARRVPPLDRVIESERAPWLLVAAPVRHRGVRVRRVAIPADLPGTPAPAAARRGGRVRVARRGA